MTVSRCLALAGALASVAVSCGGSGPDPRYPSHEAGCPVKSFPSQPSAPTDDLGIVEVECAPGRGGCERQALDVVCRRGGDIAWGFGDNALTATKLVVHAAHSRRAVETERTRGCTVRVYEDLPPAPTENIGAVTAACSLDDSRERCLRELEDQVCLLGGDVLWQVDGPSPQATSEGPKQRMRGRAAHTK
jgi:hypothetical protein